MKRAVDESTRASESRLSAASTSYQHQQPDHHHPRRYRGIFSSSICGMFQSSHEQDFSKTDACALACCGVWLWERNQFLLTSTYPTPISQRPMILALVILSVAAFVIWSFDSTSILLPFVTVLILAGVLFKLQDFQQSRWTFRKKLVAQTFLLERGDDATLVAADASEDDLLSSADMRQDFDLHMRQHGREIHGKHSMCGCAPVDADLNDQTSGQDAGFLTRLWNFIATSCCGTICCCWLQCCGVCAIAQEHRHLKTTVLAKRDTIEAIRLWQRDYITMQPWADYFPQILELRRKQEYRFWPHLSTLSTLSFRLLVGVGILLIGLVVLTALPVAYSKWELIVLFVTLLQPVIILFIVHWVWYRLDISIDALIKYFASGFVVCTSMAIAYEMILSILVYGVLFISGLFTALVLLLTGQISSAKFEAQDDDSVEIALPKIELPIGCIIAFAIVGAFLNAFVVAALVEELCKYLCFWMVEHPDLEENVWLKTNNSEDKVVAAPRSRVSLESRGAAITIAMVTTALGFACAENLLYVFVYSPPGLASELMTLVVRCIFPIHPLAAALQSLGVCRRDLEGDSNTKVGRILLPGWILHGTYDFTIMAYTLVKEMMKKYNDEQAGVTHGTNKGAPAADDDDDDDDKAGLFVFISMIYFALTATIYYFKEAWAQRRRLADLDQSAAGQSVENLHESLTASSQIL